MKNKDKSRTIVKIGIHKHLQGLTLKEIEAIQDPAISELEGATEMDAPMLEKGYYYEQAVEEKKAENPKEMDNRGQAAEPMLALRLIKDLKAPSIFLEQHAVLEQNAGGTIDYVG